MAGLGGDGVPGLVRGVQERAARALPAVSVERLGGWWLRRTDGSAWWVGAVLPHGDLVAGELVGRVEAAEGFYAGHGELTRFQVTPGVCPVGLDGVLAARGYRYESPMLLQWASTARVMDRLSVGLRICLDDRPTDEWFATWLAVHGGGGDPLPDWDALGRVRLSSAYVSVCTEVGVVAVGRGVVEAGWVGVFGMATLPAARGRGAATAVLAALARWADGLGAGRMYLQVERDNVGARRLYERAGFAELCRYHYRTAALVTG